MLLPPLLLLTACGDGGAAGGRAYAEDYAGREGSYLELGPAEDPQATPLILHIDGGRWVLRSGADWVTADELADYPYDLSDGLVVGDTTLLPPRLATGETADGVEVVARGAIETWYGTFEDAFTLSVSGGPWDGEQVFARDIGPIRVTFEGAVSELAYYE